MASGIYICQWCGSEVEIAVDPSAGRRQELIDDCETCCRPNVLHISVDYEEDNATIEALREND